MPAADLADVEAVVRVIATVAVNNEKYFGDLDAVVGDGDFGYSMARGFELVLQGWDDFDRADIGTFLKKVAIVITSRIGGTSGPIWGTAFLRAGTTAGPTDRLEPAQIIAMLRAATEGIKARGKSDVGDKTLLDALIPAVDTIEEQISAGHDSAAIVRAAPPMDYVLETSKLLASPKGVLHIINNYTGDRMAFEMGQEMAEADGITIGTLIVDDDVAVKDLTYTVGRRGVAGNFFVIKAVGAASEQGAGLDELLRIGNKVNSVTRTMGMALTSCTPPAKGSPLFDLGDDEMEMGVGIHGEPGRRREKLASANEIVDELLEAVVSDLPFGRGDDVALMINGLGGTPISELYLLYGYAHEQLAQRGINVRRNYVGEYCTSLDMAGTSITLSRLDQEIADLLAASAEIAIRTF